MIARPLLDNIQREVKVTENVEAKHPWIRDKCNAAVFLNPEFPGGVGAALKAVRSMLAGADRETSASRRSRIDKPINGIGKQVAPAMLEGAVIRELLGLHPGHGSPIASIWPTLFEVIIDINLNFKPVEATNGDQRHHPSEVDAAEFKDPDPRRAAKARIEEYIKEALAAFSFNHHVQCVAPYKVALSKQYVFARLEGRVILKLVEIDRRHAGRR